MNNIITAEKLKKYFSITAEALEKVKNSPIDEKRKEHAADFLDMCQRYYDDARHFEKKGEWVLAYGALNYAHAWLDAGARLGFFEVHDNELFTAD